MPSAIIGSKGFIGSRLQWYADHYLDEEWIGIHRENYDMWKGHGFRKVIWAAGSARKDLSAADLMERNVVGLHRAVTDFPCVGKFIYISSQAVYSSHVPGYVKASVEHEGIETAHQGLYGLSKYLGEVIVDGAWDHLVEWLILRPNGFVGPGLKKNVIHSLAKDPPELYYSWDSRFQVIHTDIFAAISFMLASSSNSGIFNVTSPEVITPVDVANYMGIDIKTVVQPKDRVPPNVQAVMDTSKLRLVLKENNIQLPTTEEAIRKWDEPFGIKVPMSGVRSPMGESRGWR